MIGDLMPRNVPVGNERVIGVIQRNVTVYAHYYGWAGQEG